MRALTTTLPGVLIFEPAIFSDARGHFFESFNAKTFEELTGLQANFVQDNSSYSSKGVLRGLHYQIQHAQGKLVRVTAGEVLDVVVDIRRHSASFGRWLSVRLSSENNRQLWVPPGFAHGFITLSESAQFQYKTTDYWMREHERSILWNDPAIAIGWKYDGIPSFPTKTDKPYRFSMQRYLHEVAAHKHQRRTRSYLPRASVKYRRHRGSHVQPDGSNLCHQHHRSRDTGTDRKSTRLNSSHVSISYAVFCLK